MTTNATGAYGQIKTMITAAKPASMTGGLRWQNEDGGALSDDPEPFAYIEFITEPGVIAGFGGGVGRNLYRNPGRVDVYVFIPKGRGLVLATDLAEALVAPFRSYRDDKISCWSASVLPGGDGASIKPPGLSSEVGNYFFAVGEVLLTFDQIG